MDGSFSNSNDALNVLLGSSYNNVLTFPSFYGYIEELSDFIFIFDDNIDSHISLVNIEKVGKYNNPITGIESTEKGLLEASIEDIAILKEVSDATTLTEENFNFI